VANYNGNSITTIDPLRPQDTGVRAVVEQPADNRTALSQPTITGKAVNRWTGGRTPLMGVLNDWMTSQQSWPWAAGPFDSLSSDSISWAYNWGDSLVWGENYLNIVPLEMQAATNNNLGLGTPFAGNRLTYPIYRINDDAYGVGGVSQEIVSAGFRLSPCYPNPSRGTVTIDYQLPRAEEVNLRVFNIAGQLVKTIDQGPQGSGCHQLKLNTSAMANGVYFFRLQAGGLSATGKITVLK
jgi:hypothetical protein